MFDVKQLHKILLLCFIATVETNMEVKLRNHLFTGYDPLVRPIHDPKLPINISFDMNVRRLIMMDERGEKLTVQASYEVFWVDEALTWNPTEWDNITELILNRKNVWTPALTLLSNSEKEAPKPHGGTDFVLLLPNGSSHWRPIVTLTAEYTVRIRYFPFDLQVCNFRFASWTLDVSKLDILPDNRFPLIDQFYVESSEWEIHETKKQIVHPLLGGENRFTQVHFTFHFVRKPLYYVVTLIIPCLILMAIVLFSYMLPPMTGERMGVIVTVLLAFFVFLEVLRSTLPQNAETTSLLAIYYLISMVLCTFSLLASCLVLAILHKNYETRPPPWIQKILHLAGYSTPFIDVECGEDKENVIKGDSRLTIEEKHVTWNDKTPLKTDMDDKDFFISSDNDSGQMFTSNEKQTESAANVMLVVAHLKKILRVQEAHYTMVKVKNEKERKESDRMQHNHDEWKLFADLLDRASFLVFLVSFIFSTLVILMPAVANYCRRV